MEGVKAPVLVAPHLVLLLVISLASLANGLASPPPPPPHNSLNTTKSPPPPPARTVPKPPPPPAAAPPKKYHVAVEGVVYCKSCKLQGYNKDLNASPLPGAVVKLACNVTILRRPYVVNATTDKNGYYLVLASPKVTSLDVERCKVSLVSSPLAICKKPSNYNRGVVGAGLKFQRKISDGKSVYYLYTPGLLLFSPTYSTSCPSKP